RNGISRVTDCSAAREYFHVLPDGRVESCPFAQYATDLNMKDHSILDITSSDFFSGIRELTKLGLPGMTPCQAPSLTSLQTGFAQLGAKPTTR
ncbi:MAG TPA: hypothetical protein VE973_00465, partial [Candidatus Limnocylindria bacterium]|nr:hypothetical protein [Candidatus Limnocylindria bacterium]